MKPLWKLKCGMLLALCVNAAYADDSANDKIMQLQKMLEQQQIKRLNGPQTNAIPTTITQVK